MLAHHCRLSSALALLVVLVLSAPARAAFLVEAYDSAFDITSMAQAEALMQGSATALGWYDTINFNDVFRFDGHYSAANGYANAPFPGGLSETFALRATSTLLVATSGYYTFGFDSDDGAILRIGGLDTVSDPALHGRRTTLASTWLDAGAHALELVYYENHSTATIELFAAAGTHTSFSFANFGLLGAPDAPGNLSTLVPLPPSAALLALAALPLLLRRRG